MAYLDMITIQILFCAIFSEVTSQVATTTTLQSMDITGPKQSATTMQAVGVSGLAQGASTTKVASHSGPAQANATTQAADLSSLANFPAPTQAAGSFPQEPASTMKPKVKVTRKQQVVQTPVLGPPVQKMWKKDAHGNLGPVPVPATTQAAGPLGPAVTTQLAGLAGPPHDHTNSRAAGPSAGAQDPETAEDGGSSDPATTQNAGPSGLAGTETIQATDPSGSAESPATTQPAGPSGLAEGPPSTQDVGPSGPTQGPATTRAADSSDPEQATQSASAGNPGYPSPNDPIPCASSEQSCWTDETFLAWQYVSQKGKACICNSSEASDAGSESIALTIHLDKICQYDLVIHDGLRDPSSTQFEDFACMVVYGIHSLTMYDANLNDIIRNVCIYPLPPDVGSVVPAIVVETTPDTDLVAALKASPATQTKMGSSSLQFNLDTVEKRASTNECLNPNLNSCDDNADCIDKPEYYRCVCKAGFNGNGITCCAHGYVLNGLNCIANEIACQDGFKKMGKDCIKNWVFILFIALIVLFAILLIILIII